MQKNMFQVLETETYAIYSFEIFYFSFFRNILFVIFQVPLDFFLKLVHTLLKNS